MLLPFVRTVNAWLSDFILIAFPLAVGIFFSVQTRFVQIRAFPEGLQRVLSARENPRERAALLGTLGAGNLIGVSGAILHGGPGAVFWLWVLSFFGMAAAYAEAVLSVRTHSEIRDGHFRGGPVYYIAKAFGEDFATFFAFSAALTFGFVGPMAQSNAVAAAFRNAFGVPSWFAGLVLVGLCGAVFFGGVKRIASLADRLAPFAALAFLGTAAVILLARIAYLPAALWTIVKCAFAPNAIIGGGYGAALKIAVSQGAKRGLFSHEAGLGSSGHAHAQSGDTPHAQGVAAMTAVFLDSFVVLTVNALVIVSTLYADGAPLEYGYTGAALTAFNASNLTQSAFGTVFGGGFGRAFVAADLFFLAFPAILRWNAFGRFNMTYLFGRDSAASYRIAALIFIFLGTLAAGELVWELADLFDALTLIPNACALVGLGGMVFHAARQADRERAPADPDE